MGKVLWWYWQGKYPVMVLRWEKSHGSTKEKVPQWYWRDKNPTAVQQWEKSHGSGVPEGTGPVVIPEGERIPWQCQGGGRCHPASGIAPLCSHGLGSKSCPINPAPPARVVCVPSKGVWQVWALFLEVMVIIGSPAWP